MLVGILWEPIKQTMAAIFVSLRFKVCLFIAINKKPHGGAIFRVFFRDTRFTRTKILISGDADMSFTIKVVATRPALIVLRRQSNVTEYDDFFLILFTVFNCLDYAPPHPTPNKAFHLPVK